MSRHLHPPPSLSSENRDRRAILALMAGMELMAAMVLMAAMALMVWTALLVAMVSRAHRGLGRRAGTVRTGYRGPTGPTGKMARTDYRARPGSRVHRAPMERRGHPPRQSPT